MPPGVLAAAVRGVVGLVVLAAALVVVALVVVVLAVVALAAVVEALVDLLLVLVDELDAVVGALKTFGCPGVASVVQDQVSSSPLAQARPVLAWGQVTVAPS